jgi:hypothetical protein
MKNTSSSEVSKTDLTPKSSKVGNWHIPSLHTQFKTEFHLRILNLPDITEKDISAWADLENYSLEDNANLSPHFVLPAIRNFEDPNKIILLFIEKLSSGHMELTGVAVFKTSPPNKHFPLPHLTMFDIAHTSLCGMLIHKESAKETLETIFSFLHKSNHRWHAVYCDKHSAEGPLYDIEHEVATSLGSDWREYRRWEQATLLPSECDDTHLNQQISKPVRKNLERRLRRFEELGKIEWKVKRGCDIDSETINRFLELEHIGWKGKAGSSLLSKPANLNFFIETVNNFQKEARFLFTEFLLNDQVISSTTSFISGRSCFCFKLGWDPKYAKLSPGTLNLFNWFRYGSQQFREFDLIDSGASEDSFVNEIWGRRRTFHAGVYALSSLGGLVSPALYEAYNLKRKIRTFTNKTKIR